MDTSSLSPHTPPRLWRWLAAAVVVANIAFNYISNVSGSAPSMEAITLRYDPAFTPAGYAFSIWGVIYFSLLVYAVVQLLPSQRAIRVYDRLAIPVIVANVLTSVWIVVFRSEMIGLSVGVIAATLVAAGVLFVTARRAIERGERSAWLTVPFSLLFGWLSVATIANAAIWLKSEGWSGGSLGEPTWAAIMVCVAGLLGLAVSFVSHDFLYPAVVSWAAIAIWSEHRQESELLGTISLAVGIMLGTWAIIRAVRSATEHRPTPPRLYTTPHMR